MTRTQRRVSIIAQVLMGLLFAGCDVVDAPPNPDEPIPEVIQTTATTVPQTTTTTVTQVCERQAVTEPIDLQGSAAEQSISLTDQLVGCADTVVLARPGGLDAAIDVALTRNAPLIAWQPEFSDQVLSVIDRLGASTIVVTSASIQPQTDTPVEVVVPGAAAQRSAAAVWLLNDSTTDPALQRYVGALAGAEVIVDTPFGDLDDEQLNSLRTAEEVVWLPEPTPTERWQLTTLVDGVTTLNGTPDLLEGTRYVAFYGNPTTGALGVLGEQGAQATLDRLAPIVTEYAADGAFAIPTFEIIVTVADAVAGDDGDYSAEMDASTLRPWIEAATTGGAYVLLDLQPGRTDFLTQAQRYEEFLRLPHVGLALDPEWRLGPDERHLRQIGSVTAAEINRVSDWLAGIVREEVLPQKMLLIHQFRLDMVENRELVELRPELATVIQMDGQGPLSTKYETYSALTAPADADRFAWGWKNFYDEDTPTATAAQVLALDPLPVLVTFQ